MKLETTRCAALLGASLILGIVTARAQEPEATTAPVIPDLPETVILVSPTKFPLGPEDVGSAITVITGTEIEVRQIRSFQDAIKLSPGVVIAPTGQPGAVSSVFLRGTNSNQTQFVVDGIRVNDSNIASNLFLGGEMAHHVGQIEVLRGPQSALYGGEAIGGVISLISPRGTGDPSAQFDVLAGSFGTFGSQLSGQGADGRVAYSFSTGYETTQNDRVNNDFDQLYYATRWDFAITDQTAIGLTVRGSDRTFGSPGSIYENDLDNIDRESFLLLTSYLDHQVTETWNSHLIAGYLYQDYDSNFPPFETNIENEKLALDWRNTLSWQGGHTTLLGIGYENTSVSNNGFGAIDESDSLFALYAQQMLQVTKALSLTGGGRWEQYDSFGEAITWRGAAAYNIEQTGTTFRASAGTGFRAPSFFELYAQNAFFIGNPDLDPEESFGWDAGVEQKVADLGSVAVTYFQNDLSDLIVSDFSIFPSSVINLEDASTSGVEVEWRGDLADRVFYQLAYTYLEADNETQNIRLLRRPSHTFGFDLHTRVTDRLTLGVGGYLIQDRLDVDAFTFATIVGDDYFLGRIYGNLNLMENVDVHLRVENAFDEEYDEVNGYPGRGLGVFGGVKVRF